VTDQSGPGAAGQPYGTQPPYGNQPPYGAQPPYRSQPPYRAQPTQGTQPPSGAQPTQGTQPPYGAQPPYRAQPPYPGQPPSGAQPPYPGQPPSAAQPPYGETQPPRGPQAPLAQPPLPGNQPAPRRRRRLWAGIAGAAVVIVAVIVVVVVTTSNGPAAAPPAPNPKGPLACDVPGNPVNGSGQWTFAAPQTVCGLPKNNSAQMLQADQEAVASLEELLSAAGLVGPSPGQYKSSVVQAYQSPAHVLPYRSVAFTGLEGKFHTGPALAALESVGSQYQSPFHSVPAGPHGGEMGCAVVTTGTWECVWATTTTLGDIQLIDTSGELAGSHLAANAVRIRDVLEASS
jgi:hypothetical protein